MITVLSRWSCMWSCKENTITSSSWLLFKHSPTRHSPTGIHSRHSIRFPLIKVKLPPWFPDLQMIGWHDGTLQDPETVFPCSVWNKSFMWFCDTLKFKNENSEHSSMFIYCPFSRSRRPEPSLPSFKDLGCSTIPPTLERSRQFSHPSLLLKIKAVHSYQPFHPKITLNIQSTPSCSI